MLADCETMAWLKISSALPPACGSGAPQAGHRRGSQSSTLTCSGRALSLVRPIACPCRKWRGGRASADSAVWRWRGAIRRAGCRRPAERLVTRKPGRAPLRPRPPLHSLRSGICSELPGYATHWIGRAMVVAVGVGLRAGQRLLAGASAAAAPHSVPSRAPTIPSSPRRPRMPSSAPIWTRPSYYGGRPDRREEPNPRARSNATGFAAGPGKWVTMIHDYKRYGTIHSVRRA